MIFLSRDLVLKIVNSGLNGESLRVLLFLLSEMQLDQEDKPYCLQGVSDIAYALSLKKQSVNRCRKRLGLLVVSDTAYCEIDKSLKTKWTVVNKELKEGLIKSIIYIKSISSIKNTSSIIPCTLNYRDTSSIKNSTSNYRNTLSNPTSLDTRKEKKESKKKEKKKSPPKYSEDFEKLWLFLPQQMRRGSKRKAYSNFLSHGFKNQEELRKLCKQVKAYSKYMQQEGKERTYKCFEFWLSGGFYEGDWEVQEEQQEGGWY